MKSATATALLLVALYIVVLVSIKLLQKLHQQRQTERWVKEFVAKPN